MTSYIATLELHKLQESNGPVQYTVQWILTDRKRIQWISTPLLPIPYFLFLCTYCYIHTICRRKKHYIVTRKDQLLRLVHRLHMTWACKSLLLLHRRQGEWVTWGHDIAMHRKVEGYPGSAFPSQWSLQAWLSAMVEVLLLSPECQCPVQCVLHE